MSPREEKRQRSKIRNALLTDENMVRALDDLFGPGNYAYDQESDVWVSPDRDYTGPDRGFIVVERGGNWFKAVLPPAVVQ
jgi:hypothetical protein